MKRVLITGATGAIGEATVLEFAKNGFFVYIHYNSNKKKAEEILESINSNGELVCFNINDKVSIANALQDLEIDVLINNAGVIKDKLFFFMENEDFQEVIDTNLSGTFAVTKIVGTSMIKRKSGSIVNIASISGMVGNAGQANYSAAKGGVIALTKTLSIELGRYGIRVNALAPGVIQSEMIENIQNRDALKKSIPLKRFGRADEVAKCAYFIGVEATYVSGEVMNISGGLTR